MRKLIASSVLLCLGVAPTAAVVAQGFPTVQAPQGNPITATKALLGKALFWDEQLSSTRTVACATCHMPGSGGTDPRVRFPVAGQGGTVNPGPDARFGTSDDRIGSPGVPGNLSTGTYRSTAWGLAPQVTGRKAPSMINAAFAPTLFWDGRASAQFLDPITRAPLLNTRAALESQAAGPPVSEIEMGHVGIDWSQLESRLGNLTPLALAHELPTDLAGFVAGRTYAQLFQLAFGSSGVSAARVAMAIATYERTLVSADSRFDRWDDGRNPQWLSAQELRGRNVFFGRGNCNSCHSAPAFTDHNFHRLGLRPETEDLGRFAVTGSNGDRGKFKTPTLRNVGLQRHFMHNGALASLEEVVEFYDRGGDFPPTQINALGLSAQEKADLVAFLHALTDERVRDELPPFDRPRLFIETDLVPAEYGFGSVGSGGFVQDLVSIEPAKLGNPRWTIGVERGLGGAPAVLLLDFQPAPAGGLPVAGMTLFLGAQALVVVGVSTMAADGPGAGWSSLSLGIPSDVGLAGGQLFLQWISFDGAASLGLSASEAVRVTLF
ncbi:MAG: hypothetical protein IT457_00920 [Planctomycetes bacterium]|nr:hypothetical protein [Planctomycetota bacterium]